MPKRTPSNTAQSLLKAAQSAAMPDLVPPAHMALLPEDLEFWPAIVRARAREEWTDHDLVVASQLAHCQACIRRESQWLHVEGTVLTNERGTPVANPRCSVLESLARREMAFMRTLQMGGKVAGADPRQLAGTRRNENLARQAAQSIATEDLLA